MDYKKYIEKAKNVLLGTVLASSTLSCSDNKAEQDIVSEEYGLLANKNARCEDLSGNFVDAKVCSVRIYESEDMEETDLHQLYYACDIKKSDKNRNKEKTFAQKVILPGGDVAYVETYKDGVLRDNASLIVIDNTVKLVGDERTYAANLDKYLRRIEKDKENTRNKIMKKARSYYQKKRVEKNKEKRDSVYDVKANKVDTVVSPVEKVNVDNKDFESKSAGVKKDSVENNAVYVASVISGRNGR